MVGHTEQHEAARKAEKWKQNIYAAMAADALKDAAAKRRRQIVSEVQTWLSVAALGVVAAWALRHWQ